MRNFVTVFVVIVFSLTILGADGTPLSKCQKDLRVCKNEKDLKFKKCPVVIGPSKDAFKKNLPQDYCAIFRKGGPKAGQLRQGNGEQIFTGVCSNTPQGEIPKVENMPSSLIIAPGDGQKLKKDKAFKVKVRTTNLELGFFSNPILEYNALPQALNKKGLIKGHQHVTVQFLGTRKNMKLPDATDFEFFKGLNDPSGNGILEVEFEGLSRKGLYRICTIISSFTHQPVVLPKAQRGASDDCIRVDAV